jgi:hypothetical protein
MINYRPKYVRVMRNCAYQVLFNMIAFVGFIVWIIYLSRNMKDIPDYYYMVTRIA